MAWIAPLDLRTILLYNLAGSTTIFLFLSVIVIMILAAKFRMPNTISLIILALYVIIMGSELGQGPIILVTLVTGIVVFYMIGKPFKY